MKDLYNSQRIISQANRFDFNFPRVDLDEQIKISIKQINYFLFEWTRIFQYAEVCVIS